MSETKKLSLKYYVVTRKNDAGEVVETRLIQAKTGPSAKAFAASNYEATLATTSVVVDLLGRGVKPEVVVDHHDDDAAPEVAEAPSATAIPAL